MTSPSSSKLTWARRIRKALKSKYFTAQDKYDSAEWTCCAVGERFKPSQRLLDKRLMVDIFERRTLDLGLDFTEAVEKNDIRKAQKLYTIIKKLPDSEKKF